MCPCETAPENAEHVLQTCPLYHSNRSALWPQETTFNDKLYGGLEQLTTTAQFITSIGLVVWILQFINFENEEEGGHGDRRIWENRLSKGSNLKRYEVLESKENIEKYNCPTKVRLRWGIIVCRDLTILRIVYIVEAIEEKQFNLCSFESVQVYQQLTQRKSWTTELI